MRVITGVRRDEVGTLRVVVTHEDGSAELADICDWTPAKGSDNTIRLRRPADLGELKRQDGAMASELVGLRIADPRQSPVVYTLDVSDESVAIPSHLLVLSLFGGNRPLREALLRPGGAEALLDRVEAMGRHRPAWAAQVEQRAAWLHRSGDMRRMWSSVYSNALTGQFDVNLAEGLKFDLILRARRTAGHLVATNLQVTLMSELLPAQHDNTKTSRADLSEQSAAACTAHMKDADAESDRGRLTEDQWTTIAPFLFKALKRAPEVSTDRRKKYRLRDVLEFILAQHASPGPWQDGAAISRRARVIDGALRAARCWPDIYQMLGSPDKSLSRRRLTGSA